MEKFRDLEMFINVDQDHMKKVKWKTFTSIYTDLSFVHINGPRLCEVRPGSPLKVVEFWTISGDFKLQQKSASAKIFTINFSVFMDVLAVSFRIFWDTLYILCDHRTFENLS